METTQFPMVKCPACDGKGRLFMVWGWGGPEEAGQPCTLCNETGEVEEPAAIIYEEVMYDQMKEKSE